MCTRPTGSAVPAPAVARPSERPSGNKLKELKTEFDYSEYGGAPILGVKGPIVKMHGASDAKAVKNTIIKAIPFAREDVVSIIQNAVLDIEEIKSGEQQDIF